MRKLLGVMFVLFFVVILSGVLKGDESFRVVKRDLSIAEKPVYVEDEIVVTFQKGSVKELEAKLINEFGLIRKDRRHYTELFTVFKTHKTGLTISALIERVKAVPGVLKVDRCSYFYAFGVPNDPAYRFQWHMKRIGMESVWGMQDGAEVFIAVIDSGVDQGLSDFALTDFEDGWDFVNNDNDPTDDNGHGSHVAGTVAQSTNNNYGVAGVAHKSAIIPIKTLDSNGKGYDYNIALSIRWAADHGADIINLSLGGGHSPLVKEAVNYAWDKGIVIVCAAGNDGNNIPHYPAAYENCISVSATGFDDKMPAYSSYGSTIDIAAPGGDLTAFLNGSKYPDGILQQIPDKQNPHAFAFLEGTSMACPHVTGVAAILKSKNLNITNRRIKEILYLSATDIGAPGVDDRFGHGLLDADKAVRILNSKAVAYFEANIVGLHVQFMDMSTTTGGEIVSWSWDFGEGGIVAEKDPVHLYKFAGTYLVSLTVTDSYGNISIKTRSVTVKKPIPSHKYCHIQDITATKSFTGTKCNVTACITVVDEKNDPVSGATILFYWDECPYPVGAVAVTDSTGKGYHSYSFMTLPSKRVRVLVTNITNSPYTYLPQNNVKDRLYIDIP